jgi:dolichol-phosphate mannosyltransferase
MLAPAAAPTGPGERATLKLGLILPTLCEEENIGRLLPQVRAILDSAQIPFEIVVVDDDSSDGTGAVVEAIAKEDPRVRLLVRKGEKGLAGAVLDGWNQTSAAVLGVMDADLQHPPELLPQLFAAIGNGRDLAIGSRYTQGGGIGDWNVVRRFLSSAAVLATWPVQRRGARAKDPMSGFFMLRRTAIEQVPLQRAGFKLLLEILVRGRIASVEEIPISFGLRSQGASKANLRVGWDYACLLARLYAARFGLGGKVRRTS